MKSSSAVQEVELTRRRHGLFGPLDKSFAYWAVSTKRERKAERSSESRGLKIAEGRSCRGRAVMPYFSLSTRAIAFVTAK